MVAQPTETGIFQSLANGILQGIQSENTVSAGVDMILQHAVKTQASDILLEPRGDGRYLIRYRINGRFHTLLNIPATHADRVMNRLKVLANIPVYVTGKALDGRIDMPGDHHKIEIRMSVVPVVKGQRAVLRILDPDRTFKSLTALGFSEDVEGQLAGLIQRDQGLIVVCGSTSSGKTTTLYALLDAVAAAQGDTRQIILVEDPVEYSLERIPQIQVNEENGFGFEAALRAMLRQDPEVIGIGEIRDRVTAKTAVRAALTGHLVLATLHTGSPEEVPARLRELGADRRLTAGALIGILHQTLMPLPCSCRNRETHPETSRSPVCDICLDTGISGRKARGTLRVPDADFRRRILNRDAGMEKDPS